MIGPGGETRLPKQMRKERLIILAETPSATRRASITVRAAEGFMLVMKWRRNKRVDVTQNAVTIFIGVATRLQYARLGMS
jgi:hypothetical protein